MKKSMVLLLALLCFPARAHSQIEDCRLASVGRVAQQGVGPCIGITYSGSWGNASAESFEPSLGVRALMDGLIVGGVLDYSLASTRDSTIRDRLDLQVDLLTSALGFSLSDLRLDPLLTVRIVQDELKRDESFVAWALGAGTWIHLDPSASLFVSLQPSIEKEDFAGMETNDRGALRISMDGQVHLPGELKLAVSGGYSEARLDSPFEDYRLDTRVGLEIETRVPGLKVTPSFVFRRDSEPPTGVTANDYAVKFGLSYSKATRDPKIRYADDEMILYQAPDHEALQLRGIPTGTQVRVSSCLRGWCWISITPASYSSLGDSGPREGFAKEDSLKSDRPNA